MYSKYIQFIATTYLHCLDFTMKNILITIEITSPITAIANNTAKAVTAPLLSSEPPSLLTSVETIAYS